MDGLRSSLLSALPSPLLNVVHGESSRVASRDRSRKATSWSEIFGNILSRFPSSKTIDDILSLRIIPETIDVPRIGEVSTEVFFFAGSAVIGSFYIFFKRRRQPPPPRQRQNRRRREEDDHSGSDICIDVKEEAEIYAWKKEHGYKDPGLYQFIDTCKQSRQTLKHVQDPEQARIEKMQRLKQEAKNKPDNKLGLSPERLQKIRRSLNNVNVRDLKQ